MGWKYSLTALCDGQGCREQFACDDMNLSYLQEYLETEGWLFVSCKASDGDLCYCPKCREAQE